MAVAAQFFYVAAQAGIFSFFINYMTTQTPPLPSIAFVVPLVCFVFVSFYGYVWPRLSNCDSLGGKVISGAEFKHSTRSPHD